MNFCELLFITSVSLKTLFAFNSNFSPKELRWKRMVVAGCVTTEQMPRSLLSALVNKHAQK
jgi:hypothetical protein